MTSYDWNLYYGLLLMGTIPTIAIEFREYLPDIALRCLSVLLVMVSITVAYMRDPRKTANRMTQTQGSTVTIPPPE
jgi:hypothetical protein